VDIFIRYYWSQIPLSISRNFQGTLENRKQLTRIAHSLFTSQKLQVCRYSRLRTIEYGILCSTFAAIAFYHYHPVPAFWAFRLNL
jgi:hypothetical protein